MSKQITNKEALRILNSGLFWDGLDNLDDLQNLQNYINSIPQQLQEARKDEREKVIQEMLDELPRNFKTSPPKFESGVRYAIGMCIEAIKELRERDDK